MPRIRRNPLNCAINSYYGTSRDGAITRSSNATEAQMVNATTYTLNSGVTMTAPTAGNICIFATESITINGTLSAETVSPTVEQANPLTGQNFATGGSTTGRVGVINAVDRLGSITAMLGIYQGLITGINWDFNMPFFPYTPTGCRGAIGSTGAFGGGGGGVPGGGGGGYYDNGGNGSAGGTGTGTQGVAGTGGFGGGVIILCAPVIRVGSSALIICNGGNGTNGTFNSGSGGGGSGGLLFISTEQLIIGTVLATYLRATGGNGGGTSGGGVGGAAFTAATNGTAPASGGGRGGGGAGGVIILQMPETVAVV